MDSHDAEANTGKASIDPILGEMLAALRRIEAMQTEMLAFLREKSVHRDEFHRRMDELESKLG